MKTNNNYTESDSFRKLLKNGDKASYETLFLLYYDKLLHIAKGYIGNLEDAEGIVQNVFLKVWDKRSKFDRVKNTNNYLYTITKNACLDVLKHQKVKNTFSENYSAINEAFIHDEIASTLIESELEKRISAAIELLPEKRKNVFIKSRIDGMKHAEIALSLNISIRTVDNHISNALRHMRLHLKEFLTLL
ncbi:RNA polymerase sigma-70 factor [Flavicella sediminum]|uniref:RNA polymerase sigma-70 factor n=1 Tax=Flavicella sediminum TaxID=2585141 RepID=UPI001121C398|nr:RNA polymerase sigma-70 factor [Flavicella sediminum]